MLIRARIKNDRNEWIEEFEVSSIETAEHEIKEMVKYFNSTLRPGERPREFVSLLIGFDLELLKTYLNKLLRNLYRENANAYGNKTVKSNYKSWRNSINKFLALTRPNKKSYRNILKLIYELPEEFRDRNAVEFIKEQIK